MATTQIRINEKAHKAYIERCESKWGSKEIASEALIYGLEVMAEMDKYHEYAKIEAQKEVLSQLVEQDKQKETA